MIALIYRTITYQYQSNLPLANMNKIPGKDPGLARNRIHFALTHEESAAFWYRSVPRGTPPNIAVNGNHGASTNPIFMDFRTVWLRMEEKGDDGSYLAGE